MDENLVGYLLDALDPETHRHVEEHLRANPQTQRRLAALRRLLKPLEADRSLDPPVGLADRTLACCLPPPTTLPFSSSLPAAPKMPRGQGIGHSAPWYRRGDALVAAAIILVFLGLAVPLLLRIGRGSEQYACRNNMRAIHAALVSYSDRHGGAFPRVDDKPPNNVAGVFVPLLKDAGLAGKISVTCPGTGAPRAANCCSMEQLAQMHREKLPAYGDAVRDLSCCYAYSLGYNDTGHRGLRRTDGDSIPILADRPDYSGKQLQSGNSPNHGGKGQNVLRIDGSVDFKTTRTVGIDGDDIYVNRQNQHAAGSNRHDAVLAASWVPPYPTE